MSECDWPLFPLPYVLSLPGQLQRIDWKWCPQCRDYPCRGRLNSLDSKHERQCHTALDSQRLACHAAFPSGLAEQHDVASIYQAGHDDVWRRHQLGCPHWRLRCRGWCAGCHWSVLSPPLPSRPYPERITSSHRLSLPQSHPKRPHPLRCRRPSPLTSFHHSACLVTCLHLHGRTSKHMNSMDLHGSRQCLLVEHLCLAHRKGVFECIDLLL